MTTGSAKSMRLVALGAVGILVISYMISVVGPNVRERSELLRLSKALQSLSRDRVEKAIQAFAKDRPATNGVATRAVHLEELVSGGYLRADEAKPFGGARVTLFSGADDTNPQLVLAVALSSGGRRVALLSDGSVQQLSEAKYRDQIAVQIQPGSQQAEAPNERH
jgi:hypothetical protein